MFRVILVLVLSIISGSASAVSLVPDAEDVEYYCPGLPRASLMVLPDAGWMVSSVGTMREILSPETRKVSGLRAQTEDVIVVCGVLKFGNFITHYLRVESTNDSSRSEYSAPIRSPGFPSDMVLTHLIRFTPK